MIKVVSFSSSLNVMRVAAVVKFSDIVDPMIADPCVIFPKWVACAETVDEEVLDDRSVVFNMVESDGMEAISILTTTDEEADDVRKGIEKYRNDPSLKE